MTYDYSYRVLTFDDIVEAGPGIQLELDNGRRYAVVSTTDIPDPIPPDLDNRRRRIEALDLTSGSIRWLDQEDDRVWLAVVDTYSTGAQLHFDAEGEWPLYRVEVDGVASDV